MSSSREQPDKATQWLSKRHTRWQDANHPMSPMRQKQLVEEFLAELPPLPYQCPRQTQVTNLQHTEARDRRIQLAPSASMPSLTAAYLGQVSRTINARGRVVDYKGWILTADEYRRFGYAVHTAVHLARLFPSDTSDSTYVLLGDPTMPASQINCVTGTNKRPNAQLTVNPKELKWSAADNSEDGQRTACVTNSYITVRATKALHAGEELWIDYGRDYWEHMSLYCPHCLEYGADRHNRMLICEAPAGCKRAWHQLCLRSCLVKVPKGAFHCDIHANAN